ncbi:hypothetical protein J1N35_008978 [Gossypium stocksii]|uniref:Uncharacterized protein n=1 Tax=Gossypium stocksii TaxID=47602 RepID=A0A9D3WBU8_9ROSI|nr:hypothetical protein J1N35_008978 [Gossypium stocksii]
MLRLPNSLRGLVKIGNQLGDKSRFLVIWAICLSRNRGLSKYPSNQIHLGDGFLLCGSRSDSSVVIKKLKTTCINKSMIINFIWEVKQIYVGFERIKFQHIKRGKSSSPPIGQGRISVKTGGLVDQRSSDSGSRGCEDEEAKHPSS